MYEASPVLGETHMKGLPVAVLAKPVAEGAAAASLPYIRVLVEQALAQCRQEAPSSG